LIYTISHSPITFSFSFSYFFLLSFLSFLLFNLFFFYRQRQPPESPSPSFIFPFLFFFLHFLLAPTFFDLSFSLSQIYSVKTQEDASFFLLPPSLFLPLTTYYSITHTTTRTHPSSCSQKWVSAIPSRETNQMETRKSKRVLNESHGSCWVTHEIYQVVLCLGLRPVNINGSCLGIP
jgi:hypothetical protein